MRLEPEVSEAKFPSRYGEVAALVGTPPGAAAGQALLVPGYTGSKEDFLHLLPLLARAGWRATAIDLPGQYESSGPEEPGAYSIESLAEDVTALIEQLQGGGEQVHVVGHSVGGLITRRAILDGTPVRSLTLLASGPGALGGSRGGMIGLMRPILADGGVQAVWDAARAVDAAAEGAALVPDDVRAFLERRFLAVRGAHLLGLGEAAVGAADLTDALAASGVPVLVLNGDLDDAWSPADQGEMATRLGARHVEFRGVGHSPAVEVPADTCAALLEFWASL